MKKYLEPKNILLGLVFLIISLSTCTWFLKNSTVVPYGDAIEYILITEAIYNHQSSNITKADIVKYNSYLEKNNIANELSAQLNNLTNYILYYESSNFSFDKNYIHGSSNIIVGSDDKFYAQHFWFYSALAVPARAILEKLSKNIKYSFLLTNLLIFFVGFSLILFYKNTTLWLKLIFSILYLFSPVLWYMNWQHPEVYAGVLAFLGTFYYLHHHNFRSLICFSLASIHFQPLAIPALVIIGVICYKNKLNIKLIAKVFICSFWATFPLLYSLITFQTMSIIQKAGYLSWEVVDLKRFIHFFIDPNQGVIRALPIALICFIIFFFIDFINRKNLRIYLLPASIILMSLLFMQMQNWNHGMAYVNRYAVWVSAILLAVLGYRLSLFNLTLKKFFLILPLLASQVYAICSVAEFKEVSYNPFLHTKTSEFLLTNYPHLYNPDPHIFILRTHSREPKFGTDSVIIFSTTDSIITKFMFQKKSKKELVQRGIDSEKLNTFIANTQPYHNWYYLNQKDFEKVEYNQEQDSLIPILRHQEKIKNLKMKIRQSIINSEIWMKEINAKATEWNMSVDEILDLDVEYLIQQEKIEN